MAKIAVIGGGVGAENTACMALRLGAEDTVIDKPIPRLETVDDRYQGRMKTVFSTADAIDEAVRESDLVVGVVLIPGAAALKLITRAMLAEMKPGSVLVDVAIDQGGCFETSQANPRRTHLPGEWRGPLLRGQHARRGGPHLCPVADQRYPSSSP